MLRKHTLGPTEFKIRRRATHSLRFVIKNPSSNLLQATFQHQEDWMKAKLRSGA
ncbi:hypothetical protein [Paenibacillus lentus]|uniref:hypothetical protein n=1 Tax=Paenibacillus lentus TaxID=1338368 RepID=UPI0013DE2B31|nr:hypothetical protein [Paenibacillus lentus]